MWSLIQQSGLGPTILHFQKPSGDVTIAGPWTTTLGSNYYQYYSPCANTSPSLGSLGSTSPPVLGKSGWIYSIYDNCIHTTFLHTVWPQHRALHVSQSSLRTLAPTSPTSSDPQSLIIWAPGLVWVRSIISHQYLWNPKSSQRFFSLTHLETKPVA